MDDRIEVTLISPAKVDLRTLMAGVQEVTQEELEHLKAAGVIVLVDDGAADEPAGAPDLRRLFTAQEWEAAVSGEAFKLAGQAFDGKLNKMEAELKDLIKTTEAEADALRSRLDETGQLLTAERQKSADLAEKLTVAQGEIDALKAAITNIPVAKTTAKKGAATS